MLIRNHAANRPRWPSHIAAAAALAAVLALTFREPVVAAAAAAPDDAALATMREATRGTSLLRVTTTRAEFLAGRARFDSAGVHLARLDRHAALVTVSVPRPEDAERRIAWSDVERIEAGHSRLGIGLGVGLAVGAALGAVTVANHWHDVRAGGDGGLAVYFAGLLVIGGGTAGLLLGGANPSLHTIYP